MVFVFVASNSLKMPPVFLKSGFRMGAKEYLDQIVMPHILPFSNNVNIILMHDGAPCHTSKFVQKWLAYNF